MVIQGKQHFWLVLLLCQGINARIVEQLGLFRQKDDIGGIIFDYRHESLNGKTLEEWRINQEPVDKVAFDKRRIDAQQQEWEQERVKAEQDRQKKQDSLSQSRITIMKKLISQSHDAIGALVNKVDNPLFAGFIAWSPETIGSMQEFTHLKSEMLPKMIQVIGLEKIEDICVYERLITKLEQLEGRLGSLYSQTLNQAISKSDDSQVLKKLLELA